MDLRLDVVTPKFTTTLLALPPLLIVGLIYAAHRFTSRISPDVPYAGEGSLSSRLQVPVEYAKDPVEFLRKTRRELGRDVFCVDLIAAKMVFVLGAEGNREILRAGEEKLSFWDGIRWVFGPVMGNLIDYPGWKPASLKMVKYALQNQERLDNYIAASSKIVEEHMAEWVKKGTVPLFHSFSYLILSCVLVILVGEDFYRKYGDDLIPRMSQFEKDLQHPILRVTPNSMWKYTKPGKALMKTCERFEELIAIELKDIMENPEKHKGRMDYFYYITSQVGDKFAPCYGIHIMSVMFGGHANAAMTTPWLFLHARRTPGALERIREEAIQGPTVRKPYIDACFRETGRLYTNTTMMRVTKETTKVAGHVLPPNTIVVCSPTATQRTDKSEPGGIYEDAGKWNPERFLVDSNAYPNWFQRAEFVHFGVGIHACPGEKLARMIIFDLVLKVWMERYVLDVVGGLVEGKGVDGVGAEGAWTEENFGTPSIRGEDVIISVKRRDTGER